MRASFLLTVGLLGLPTTAHALPEWTSQGLVAPGRQFAADLDSDDRVHIIAERYVQIDGAGTVLIDEADVGDTSQGPLDMYPAIAIGPDGTTHVVTRNGGSLAGGNELRYASRPAAGGWSAAIAVGAAVPRNYVVGVAAPSGGRVLVSHGRQVQDVAAAIDVYEIANGAAALLGSTPQGWLRADGDYRLASVGNAIVLASGAPGPGAGDGVRFAMATDADADVPAQWQRNNSVLVGGGPRRGGPSLFISENEGIHVGYGALETHHYARVDASGTVTGDVQTMSELGMWHLSYGNGAVVASPDGIRIVAVVLQNPDGDATSADADILFAESTDAGATFGAAQPTGLVTDGGEGRMRPRLFEIGGTLALLYRDNGVGGIALATSHWFDEEPEGTGSGSTTDAGDDSSTSADSGPVGSTSGPADTSGSSGTPEPDTTTSDDGAQTSGLMPPPATGDDPQGGCGCQSTSPAPVSAIVLAMLCLLRPRRQAGHAVDRSDP